MPKAVIKDEKENVEDVVEDEPVAETEQADEEEAAETIDPDGTPLEELDPKEDLWEGGPTVGQALEWKNQYGRLFITSIDYDDHILWRPLLRSEYKNHVRHIEQMTNSGQIGSADANLLNEELLAETCMLWPRYDRNSESLAGVASIIAQEIMEASGFVALQVRQL